jgi:replicative DNA helicase
MHEEGKDKADTELDIAKNRNGPIDRINLHFNAGQTAFHDVDRVHQDPAG